MSSRHLGTDSKNSYLKEFTSGWETLSTLALRVRLGESFIVKILKAMGESNSQGQGFDKVNRSPDQNPEEDRIWDMTLGDQCCNF